MTAVMVFTENISLPRWREASGADAACGSCESDGMAPFARPALNPSVGPGAGAGGSGGSGGSGGGVGGYGTGSGAVGGYGAGGGYSQNAKAPRKVRDVTKTEGMYNKSIFFKIFDII